MKKIYALVVGIALIVGMASPANAWYRGGWRGGYYGGYGYGGGAAVGALAGAAILGGVIGGLASRPYYGGYGYGYGGGYYPYGSVYTPAYPYYLNVPSAGYYGGW